MPKSSSYLFILRAWSEDGRWRWSLLQSGAADRVGFSNLDELYLYLSAAVSGANDAQNEDSEPNQDSEGDKH